MARGRDVAAIGVALLAWTAIFCSVSAQDGPDGSRDGEEGAAIALQMYTLREYGTLDDQLRLAAAVGYDSIETIGTHDLSAGELADRVAAHGLRVISSHVGLGAMRNDLKAVVDNAAALGNDTVVIAWLPREERPVDAAGWAAFGRELDAIGARLREHGVRLAYHNHDFEMELVDGRPAIDHLLAAAEPDHLAWQADVAWIARGGQDPAELLRRHAGRIASIHAKDNAPPGEHPDDDGFADVGHGVLDWDAVLAAVDDAGVPWLIVEHDRPAHHEGTIRRSRQFLLERLAD